MFLALLFGVPLVVGVGAVASRIYLGNKADKWAIDSRVPITHSVRAGLSKKFYFDDANRRIVIWRLIGQPISIRYDELAGYKLVPTDKSTWQCLLNTTNTSCPLIKITVGAGAVENLEARFITHLKMNRI